MNGVVIYAVRTREIGICIALGRLTTGGGRFDFLPRVRTGARAFAAG
jgi:hypothetical protein